MGIRSVLPAQPQSKYRFSANSEEREIINNYLTNKEMKRNIKNSLDTIKSPRVAGLNAQYAIQAIC